MNEQELLFKISNQLNQVIDLLKPQITEGKPLEIIQCYYSGDYQTQEFCVGSYGVTRSLLQRKINSCYPCKRYGVYNKTGD